MVFSTAGASIGHSADDPTSWSGTRYFFYNHLCNIVWSDAAGTISWQHDNDHESIVYEIPMPAGATLALVQQTPLWTNRLQK